MFFAECGSLDPSVTHGHEVAGSQLCLGYVPWTFIPILLSIENARKKGVC